MATEFPRTLLLTRWSPSGRFAGGEVQRKMVACLPRDLLRWAYLSHEPAEAGGRLPAHRGFPVITKVHWRLKAAGVDYLVRHMAARRQAETIGSWVADFRPEVLWIASDLDGILVGHHLHHLLRIPIHITAYDAFEWCRHCGVPRWYTPLYLRHVRHLMRHVATMSGMSAALIEHVMRWQPMPECRATMVFPPSIDWRTLQGLAPAPGAFDGPVRRVGFCGASRTGPDQWAAFVRTLGRLPWRFEVVAFSASDCFHRVPTPANVTIAFQPYQPSELDVVRLMRSMGVQACYLGVWRDPACAFFARTSVSSKMTTYAACGVPIIADVPEDAAAWGLIRKHGAGVRLTGEPISDAAALGTLFKGGTEWTSYAQGAGRLCERELDLGKNIEEFKRLLCGAVDGTGNTPHPSPLPQGERE